MKYDYKQTDTGISVRYQGKLLGWIMPRVNQKFGFVPIPTPYAFESPTFGSVEEAKEAFEQYLLTDH